VFKSAEEISPYLETPHSGPTSKFCQAISKQLGCYVTAGFPERLALDEDHPTLLAPSSVPDASKIEELAPGVSPSNEIREAAPTKRSGHAVGANSAVVYGPGGEEIVKYRKTNLFETDMTWAKSGKPTLTLHLHGNGANVF
jgi:protein N-terminal amidase